MEIAGKVKKKKLLHFELRNYLVTSEIWALHSTKIFSQANWVYKDHVEMQVLLIWMWRNKTLPVNSVVSESKAHH
jgi:hypothetical protein